MHPLPASRASQPLRRLSLSLLCAAAALGGPPCAPRAVAEPRAFDTQRLFSVRSNYNRNEVVYEALLDGGRLLAQRPLRSFWVLHEKQGRLEELTAIEERLAFGFEAEAASGDEVRLKFKAAPQRKASLRLVGGRARVVMELGGQEAALAAVYAAVDKRGLLPSVKYVDLAGASVATGEPVRERVRP